MKNKLTTLSVRIIPILVILTLLIMGNNVFLTAKASSTWPGPGVPIFKPSFYVGPAGPPARPASGAQPDGSLAAHPLNYSPSPIDNPNKGFVPYFFSGTTYANAFPHSMEWSYFALSDVMTGPNTFNWAPVESMLNEVASRGNTSTIRFYVEYPGKPSGIPQFLINQGITIRNNTYWNTQSPDYDDARTITAFTNFITAFGAKYDGDVRLGYVQAGLVGLWGEWHTWPYDTNIGPGSDMSDGYPNYMPTDANMEKYIAAYAAAFKRTSVEIRYSYLANRNVNNYNLGFHDDSFAYIESGAYPLGGGKTLPTSIDGKWDAFTQLHLDVGAENAWINKSIGGEARPEIQTSLFTPGASVEDANAALELAHPTWLLNQDGVNTYSSTGPASAFVQEMGYNFSARNAYFNNPGAGVSFKVGVQIENRGVAPFYYNWQVLVGVKNSSGIIQTVSTNWDLRTIKPNTIRAFPDWNVGADPTYLPFGTPQYFDTIMPALGAGNYTLVMRVVNPLESVSSAAKKLRFANAEQGSDGWLSLGSISVNNCGTTCPTVPPTNTATSIPTNTPVRNTPTSTPTNTPPTSTPTTGGTTYEAETGTLAGGAKVVSCSSCSGGNEVGYVGNGGTLKINNISASSAGTYPLTIYYLDGDSGRSSTLSVNGGAATTINFPGTGSWTTVGNLKVNVNLNAGNNTLLFANPSGWAPDFDKFLLNTGTSPTNTPVGNTPTRTPTSTPVRNTPTSTPTTAGLLIDNFDGSPAWPGGNDLGHWSGANSFLNGGGSGVLSNGALVLQYNNTGTFNSDVNQNIAAYTYLVIRVSGASGGEQNQITLNFGGVSKNFGTFSGDTITTAYKDIKINLVSNGVNRTSPGSIQLLFTGGSSTIYIQKLSLQ